MNERDRLIQQLIKERGGTKEQYLRLLNVTAFHESGGSFDPAQKQIGGGPGRGKYQFEKGRGQGAKTAVNRTKNYYKESGMSEPAWVKKVSKDDSVDVSKLTSEQQDILFLSNLRKHPKANFQNIWDGKQSMADFWANYHWAGPQKERNKMKQKFQKDIDRFDAQQEPVEPAPVERKRVDPAIPEQVKDGVNIKQPVILDELINKYSGNLMESINTRNIAAQGGMLNATSIRNKNLNSFNTGGTHEMNPHGGIPQGTGSNGKMNTVEQGESSFDFKDGKFIFSKRLNAMALGGLTDPVDPPNKKEQLAVEQESADFLNMWNSANVTKARLAQNLGVSPIDTIKPLNEAISRVNNRPESALNQPNSNPAEGAETKGGRINYYRDVNPTDSTHELGHVSGMDDIMQPVIKEKYGTPIEAIQKKYNLPYNEAINKAYNITEEDGLIGEGLREGAKKHFSDLSGMNGKTELYPRIMEMRRIMGVKPGQKIDSKLLQKAKDNMSDNSMFKAYTDEQILDMLNTLAANKGNKNYNNLA